MNADETMLEAYLIETQQLLESLENTLLDAEHDKRLNQDQINEVFRVMHTIKGASAMMEFDIMTRLAHSLEDLFSEIRDAGAPAGDWSDIFDLVFGAVSFFNGEMVKLQEKRPLDGNADELIGRLKACLNRLKGAQPQQSGAQTASSPAQGSGTDALSAPAAVLSMDEPYYKIRLSFEENCQMENLRALGVVQSLKKISARIATVPDDLDAATAAEEVKRDGLTVFLQTGENPDLIREILGTTLFLKTFGILPIEGDDEEVPASIRARRKEEAVSAQEHGKAAEPAADTMSKQNFISVNVNKLDSLLNIVGEIVTAQSMVINNADFGQEQHESFDTAAQQLHALINELQDIVMNIRMIPFSTLFQKMRRLVRDMSKKFGKDIELELIGEETEVDKNVIDSLADPLLHIIRNSVDHGIEDAQARLAAGKSAKGKIVLQARTTGSDVIVTVSDDGKGLQRDAILKKAYEKGLISAADGELTDKEIYNLVFLPGFSTKETVTEYSGRGVGMDVVRKNISRIGGSIMLESDPGRGTTHIIRIPLTLTIVNGMKFSVGDVNFIVPTVSVGSVVMPNPEDIFSDSDGNEIIRLQGKFYSLLRLNRFFHIANSVEELSDGMIMHLASEQRQFCIFFDRLDGEYQVVVKALPGYLQHCTTGQDGLGGCAILGDGSINLILDVNSLERDVR